MKQVYLIGGTMGVGKTAICQRLKAKLSNSVFLDGDWCWDMNPFIVNDETKKMVISNITSMLNNFISCSAYRHIIFCWVMHEQNIINEIIETLNIQESEIHNISLICNPEILRERLEQDIERGIRTDDIIDKSIKRLSLYSLLDTIKVDVSDITPDTIAEYIIENC